MRLLTVRHVTVYPYAEPVRLGEHRMMFRPRESHDLRLIQTELVILPRPAMLRWLHDVFDNSVAVATFSGKTTKLSFESIVNSGAHRGRPAGLSPGGRRGHVPI